MDPWSNGRPDARVHASRLGATLYVPAARGDLLAVAQGLRYPAVRSLVMCLEDSVSEAGVPAALANVQTSLAQLQQLAIPAVERPILLLRPRNAGMLEMISHMKGADLIAGYVIPKATADTLPTYLAAMPMAHQYLLPTIESREAFEPGEMRRLREQLIAVQDRVLAIRIGGNDLLQTLGVKRSARRTAYDGPLGQIIASLVSTFTPWGFNMSAPVCVDFGNSQMLAEEVERDIEHGLLTKSAIHPAQVEIIHNGYRVSHADHEQALAIVASHAPSVFAIDGAMCEPATQWRWAETTINRAAEFGLERTRPEAISIVG